MQLEEKFTSGRQLGSVGACMMAAEHAKNIKSCLNGGVWWARTAVFQVTRTRIAAMA